MRRWLKITGLCLLAASLADRGAGAQAPGALYPQRVVSLAPSVTEMLFALGFGDRLVGVTSACDYPESARKIDRIGAFMSPSSEAIFAKRPDLVIGVRGGIEPAKARELERLGLRLAQVRLSSIDDILRALETVARWLGNAAAGATAARAIARQVEQVKQRVAAAPRRSTLLIVGMRPLIAAGGNNFIDELIALAGGENIAGSALRPWVHLPDEVVVAKAPHVIIQAGMGSESGASAGSWRDLQSIPAVREGRIYTFHSDKILRPGPRIGEGLEELARLIHPECFARPGDGAVTVNHCGRARP